MVTTVKVQPSLERQQSVSDLSKNYIISFTGKHGVTNLIVDNKTFAYTPAFDPESGEPIQFFFAIITEMGEVGDLELGKVCLDMDAAGIYHHTYDAKSGALARITRLGATRTRLERYCAATKYTVGFEPAMVKAAYEALGMKLENPEGYGGHYYPPYDHLSGPYDGSKAELYRPIDDRDRFSLFKMLLAGSTSFKGGAKGAGMDLVSLDADSEKTKFCLAVFPLHQPESRDALAKMWMKWTPPWRPLPTEEIKEYLGEEVGFYFAFLSHLAVHLTWLAPLALLGQIISGIAMMKGEPVMGSEGLAALIGPGIYALIVDKWRFEQSKLAHLWECFGCRKILPPRPGFRGVILKNVVTGKIEVDFPITFRAQRKRKTIAVSLMMIFVLAGTVFSIFLYKYMLTKNGASTLELLIPSLLNSIQITVFGFIYNYVAEALTVYENHKTQTDHNSALFRRLTFFYFINYYATLFYIAFFKGDIEGCYEAIVASPYCGRELAVQVFIVFIVNDFANRFSMSVILPYFMTKYNKLKSSKLSSMGPIEAQFRLLEKYDPSTSLVQDYIELYIQWGYLVLFGAACPIVVVLACFTDYVETRTDGRKLLWEFRRVIPNRVDGVGEPLNLFVYTLYLGVIVNAGLFVYTFGAVRFWPDGAQIWVCAGIMVFLATILVISETVYPEVPEETEIQFERQKAIYSALILGNTDSHQHLEYDESMVGKTPEQVKAEKEKEHIDMAIKEYSETGTELMAISAEISKAGSCGAVKAPSEGGT